MSNVRPVTYGHIYRNRFNPWMTIRTFSLPIPSWATSTVSRRLTFFPITIIVTRYSRVLTFPAVAFSNNLSQCRTKPGARWRVGGGWMQIDFFCNLLSVCCQRSAHYEDIAYWLENCSWSNLALSEVGTDFQRQRATFFNDFRVENYFSSLSVKLEFSWIIEFILWHSSAIHFVS